ncbi:MAG: hemerythrin domain-containing protein [Nitrososphaerales archaeon]
MTQRNLIDELCQDHNEVRRLLARTQKAAGPQRRQLFEQLVGELVRHEVAEEEILRPLSKKVADKRIANARLKEESAAEALLKTMEKLDPDSAEFERKLSKLSTAVERHAEAEETKEFPRVRDAVDGKELVRMGRVYEVAKASAPTHPHPSLPNSPEANLLAGPFVAVLDRARDAVRKGLQKVGA